jgi:hypothetical protein
MFEMKDKFTWRDRRPIAALHVASSGHTSTMNPSGYLFDLSLNVQDRDEMTRRFHEYAKGAIETMKSFNAQGGIIWEIDGCRYGSYLGCPDLALTLNPEMYGIVNEFFSTFRVNGFKMGVCIRPGEFDFVQGKLVPPRDYFTNLLVKARYARETWKCRLFYVDTNFENCGQQVLDAYGHLVDPPLLPAILFARLHQALPDCLFIPEHENVDYHLWTAPYRELRMSETGTPANIRENVSNAFSVLFLSDGNIDGELIRENASEIKASLARGDIAMVNGWFKSRETEEVAKMLM